MYPAPPTPPKKSRAWIGWIVALAVICVVGGSVYAIQSHNKNTASPAGLGASSSAGVSEPAGGQATGQPGAGVCDPADLTSCLLATPTGAKTFSSGWATERTPTVAEYVQQNFTAGTGAQNATTNLTAAGVQALAHAVWYAALDGNQIDIVLLRFSDQRGATSWAFDREGNYMAEYGRSTPVSVPGDSTAQGYTESTTDSFGFYNTHYAQAVGDIAVVIRYSSKDQASPADFQLWAGDQLARLGTAPKPGPGSSSASSVPSLPSFKPSTGCADTSEAVSAGALDDCLMSMPSGASPDTNSAYDTTENPSLAQYVAAYWSNETSDRQSYEVGLLQQYGVQEVVHRRWVADGSQVSGDVVLLGFARPVQAEGAALNQAGVDMPRNESCDSPNLPDAYCNVHPKDSSNDVWTQIIAWRGSVEVKVEINSQNTPDLTDALTWTQTELELMGPLPSN